MDTTESPPVPEPDREGEHVPTVHEPGELLREAVVGRLAVISAGEPDIFPVNVAVDHGSVVIRTAGGTKLETAHQRRVAFEVDGVRLGLHRGSSVVLKGDPRLRDLDGRVCSQRHRRMVGTCWLPMS